MRGSRRTYDGEFIAAPQMATPLGEPARVPIVFTRTGFAVGPEKPYNNPTPKNTGEVIKGHWG